ncbi:hypothetical protein [Desulfotomaculum sp. 1211_IL3151]|uniref:hypothetical protein n=1 Tax=Desulfotomaculum sp. 1211_IL3151 TaxID=3084055 RepID=UPI002FD8B61E
MTSKDLQLLVLRIELGLERLVDMSSSNGKNDSRINSYRKRLDLLIDQLNKEKHSHAT